MLAAALLRTIVYFRDTFRATNYGAPDLVQIIRAIDGEIIKQRGQSGATNDVQLSFIGHSMGGFVVTNTIRVLSDVFLKPVQNLSDYGAHAPAPPSPNIGNVFCLKRFVLASPDIPAEALLSNRGNFLASALARFDEAYLFSNEGDEVLRQISTLANYFVFPTKSRNYGFRLGNVEILSSNFGLIDVSDENFLAHAAHRQSDPAADLRHPRGRQGQPPCQRGAGAGAGLIAESVHLFRLHRLCRPCQ